MAAKRSQIEMTQEEIWAYVKAQPRLIVTSNGPGGYPHPMPMNFTVDDENRFVVVTFRKSQKILNFERDPRAALLVESGLLYSELKSVLAYADAEIINDVELVVRSIAAIERLTRSAMDAQGDLQENPDDLMQKIRASAAKRLAIRFKPHKFISWDHAKLAGQY